MTRVWDLPTRIFHWLVVVLVAFSILSAHLGGNWLDWHMRSGILILSLVVFRILWGFIGPHHARFANFVRAPSAVLAYVRAMRDGNAAVTTTQAGHNPLGALSVIAIIAVLLLQATTGLFSNEDSMGSEGPLAKYVSGATSDFITRIHKIDQFVIYVLIALHLGAILYYAIARRDNLVRPMLTGDKPVAGLVASRDDWVMRLRALVVLVVVFAAAGFLYR
jgi:cytochrome b